MTDEQEGAARMALAGAENGRLSFPDVVGALMAAGFESYAVDFRRAEAIYYRPDGDSIALPIAHGGRDVAPDFDTDTVRGAIREAQEQAPGYTYAGFCETVRRAGCSGYVVSFPGRRVVYMGRTGDMHIEHFPD